MRIISGESKGRRLTPHRGQRIRPTSDRVKESIFNILGAAVKGASVLDLFAGTGNLGIEALSRGAKRVVFVEKTRQGVRLIGRNLAHFGMGGRAEVMASDVMRAIGVLDRRGDRFDLIFMDPPYERGWIEKTFSKLLARKIFHEEAIFVVEHTRREPLQRLIEGWDLLRQREIGDSLISFVVPKRGPPGTEAKP